MHIEVIADGGHLHRWQLWLVEALRAQLAATVAVRLESSRAPLPASLTALLSFERLIGRAHLEGASDIIPMSALPVTDAAAPAADLIIDVTGATHRRARETRTLTPLFDGSPGHDALWTALLDHRAPWIEIADNRCRDPVAAGLPALESLHRVLDSAGAVYSRVVEALAQAALHISTGRTPPATACNPPLIMKPRAFAGTAVAAFAAERVKSKAKTTLAGLLHGAPRWSVAWRHTPERRRPQSATLRIEDYHVLKDDGRRFYADPFVIQHGGQTHVFVEELPYATGRGLISHFTIQPGGQASTPRPVLERPHHLSYPHVFAHGGQMWMLPEAPGSGVLELYRADPFPSRWVLEARLVEGHLHDATIFEDRGRLWLFAESDYRQSSTWDGLSLYSAEHVTGPWTPHPSNPLLVDSRAARPAGALFRSGTEIWRPVQDCSAGYGSALGFARVTRLDMDGYAQETCGRLSFAPQSGILGPHTLNWAEGLELIDLFSRP